MMVIESGWFFRATTVITLVGGTVFLMWLGEQITARGIGNGISLIIFAGIVAELPGAFAGTFELGRQGILSTYVILGFAVLAIAVIIVHRLHGAGPATAVGAVSQATGWQQNVPRGRFVPPAAQVEYSRCDSADLRFIAAVAADHGGAVLSRGGRSWLTTVTALLGPGQPLFLALSAVDDHRVLLLLLHRHRLQPEGHR